MIMHEPHATAYRNSKFILIETSYGCPAPTIDPSARKYLFELEASDSELGAAVAEALSQSRSVAADEVGSLFDFREVQQDYADRVAMLIDRYGYKTRKALFKDMRCVWIELANGTVVFTPTRQEELDGWGRIQGDGIEGSL